MGYRPNTGISRTRPDCTPLLAVVFKTKNRFFIQSSSSGTLMKCFFQFYLPFSTEVFGWLYLGNVTDPESGDDYPLANLGLKDQRLAMKFIYENIEQFGGDPNRVRILKMKRPALVEWFVLVNCIIAVGT